MCAAGFAAAHDRRTFRRTSQFTNATKTRKSISQATTMETPTNGYVLSPLRPSL